MKLLIGADPELFLSLDGNPHSGHNIIPGNKEDPYPVPNGAVQVDGMALEFNIDPASSANQFVYNINSVLKHLRTMVPKDFNLDLNSTAIFSEEHMSCQPDVAKLLGCDPDFNAYTKEANPQPDQHPVMRTAAGHVHIGWTNGADVSIGSDHFEDCCIFTRQLDYYLGLLGVIYDDDVLRKKMYGKAGAFRPKSYGLEYRVLSNFWLKSNKYKKMVFSQSKNAFNDLLKGEYIYDDNTITRYYNIVNIINKNKTKSAFSLIYDLTGMDYKGFSCHEN